VNVHKKSFQFGSHAVTLETGRMARQADGAVVVSMGDTVVLVTAVGRREAQPGKDFFPMTVNYVEKTYSAGRIPGGFFKREGRPTEKETLTSRLIDRPIRPLFPEGFYNEVQIIATVVSLDPEIDSDIPALLGASAALAISGMPFRGPIGGVRVGYVDGQYVLNPTNAVLKTSKLDLVVAGTADAVLMVESEADRLPEDVMLGAVVFGHEQMQVAIKAIKELAAAAGKPAWEFAPAALDAALAQAVASKCEAALGDAYKVTDKQARHSRISEIKQATLAGVSFGLVDLIISMWLDSVPCPFLIAAAPSVRTPRKYARPAMKHRSMVQVSRAMSSAVTPHEAKEACSLYARRWRSRSVYMTRLGFPDVPEEKTMSTISDGETARNSSLFLEKSFLSVSGRVETLSRLTAPGLIPVFLKRRR